MGLHVDLNDLAEDSDGKRLGGYITAGCSINDFGRILVEPIIHQSISPSAHQPVIPQGGILDMPFATGKAGVDMTNMDTRYDASKVESKWYARWEAAGLFQPDPDPSKRPFTVTIPPPNITGSLHMGHALCYPIQDLFGRYQRMLGRSVLILPGQDHAGIATQSVVEKMLRKEGTSGAQIGRDKFVERVWQWRTESGDTILNQLRSLGCAFDWSRSRFTLDDHYHDAVLRVFIDWFERGLIFRGKRVVNWDPVLQTSVSDIETERKTIRGKLYYIRYPFADGSGHLTIATTRPETMLADVAVAVHPSDKRYEGRVGKMLILPLMNREIPLIADQYPDPAFGSGAVKITPAHDPNDYQVGVRHKLPMPVLLDGRARITAEGGIYEGLDRHEARKRVVADLEEQGLLEKIEDYDIPILISDRSKEAIEPLLSEQWFCDQAALAGPAIEVVRQGKVKFFPERYEKIYLDWMENIREWCISRQLWWGHRIPVYYTADGTPFAALSWADAQAKAGAKKIVRQDEDVLDTWFSSGLWPLATLGWPAGDDGGDGGESHAISAPRSLPSVPSVPSVPSSDLARYYPTDLMVTDRNIIYLWVSRMIMMGLDFMHERPFEDVFIYATVLTEDGKRMSKSLGTGIDPMEVIQKIGADALRYTLLSQTGANQDIRYSERKTEEARNFCNKIWNATRFVLMNLAPPGPPGPSDQSGPSNPSHPTGRLEDVDRWLLTRLYETAQTVKKAYDGYDLQVACQALYRFFWSELCDWYIEVAKPRLSDPSRREVPQWVLLGCIDSFLRMLHPVMPFITEELYSFLPIEHHAEFIMSAPWPVLPEQFNQPEATARVERIFEVTRALRSLRADLGVTPGAQIPLAYYEGDLGEGEWIVRSQAWVGELRLGPPSETCIGATVAGVDLHLPIGDLDKSKEIEKIDRESSKAREELNRMESKLADTNFVERAKPEVVEKAREQGEELRERLRKLADRRRLFE
ncbi:MAG TPA: valine--tRNA ligase [Fimbriimonadaceae bacterium]|nr:valine--tRNA ligase [Fimbriimonadaceae bacterium]